MAKSMGKPPTQALSINDIPRSGVNVARKCAFFSRSCSRLLSRLNEEPLFKRLCGDVRFP